MSQRLKMISSLVLSATVTATSISVHATPEGDALKNFVGGKQILRLHNSIYETAPLQALYKEFGYEPLWLTAGQLNEKGLALKAVLLNASAQGLNPQEYWTPLVESLAAHMTPELALSLEISLSHALVNYARDLSTGRVDPNLVDDDIKFSRKNLDMNKVIAAVQAGAPGLAAALDAMAPQSPNYQRLKVVLARVRAEAQIAVPADQAVAPMDMIVGQSHPAIVTLKRRIKAFGYTITDESPVYTPELEAVVKNYQVLHNVGVSGKLTPKSAIWRWTSMSGANLVRKIELSMEKWRWVPQVLEPNRIVVNLATQQFRLYENNQLMMSMKTINGQTVRRTPMMNVAMPTVEFNPTWTVPFSIAVKDKLPKLQEDPSYLERNNISVFTEDDRERPLDPYNIDWHSYSKSNFPFYLQQDPGLYNALGVVKFHLNNPWAIYLHDTGERELFGENYRMLSSGCVRVEKPLDLAAYLLRNNPNWTLAKIKAAVAKGIPGENVQPQIRVPLVVPMSTYLMYLTADVDDAGHLILADDNYYQDVRLAQTLAPAARKASALAAEGEGTLTVNGEAGPSQVFKKVMAIRCDPAVRGACDQPVYFDLKTAQALSAGSYIVGFENSLYAGWVQIQAGQNKTLDLVKLNLGSDFASETQVKVYRDFSAGVEQRKLKWAYFQLGRHPFPLTVYNFGDLYPSATHRHDVVGRLADDGCDKLSSFSKATEEAKTLCDKIAQATSIFDLDDEFDFSSGASLKQSWVVPPGNIAYIELPKHLVSAPLRGNGFVSVFPGAYRAIGAQQKKPRTLTAGKVSENFGASGKPSQRREELRDRGGRSRDDWFDLL